MSDSSAKPDLLIPRQWGGRWYVEATWEDGHIQHIGNFKAEFEARNWFKLKSEAYYGGSGGQDD